MTKKCENFVIDLMHDTDSDFQMLPNPKLGSVSGMGQFFKIKSIRYLMIGFPVSIVKTLIVIFMHLGGSIGVAQHRCWRITMAGATARRRKIGWKVLSLIIKKKKQRNSNEKVFGQWGCKPFSSAPAHQDRSDLQDHPDILGGQTVLQFFIKQREFGGGPNKKDDTVGNEPRHSLASRAKKTLISREVWIFRWEL